MQPGVDVDLNVGVLDLDTIFVYDFTEKYASSIYNGFFYRNGKRHEAYDYVMTAIANRINLKAELVNQIQKHNDLEKAFEETAKKLKQAFEEELSQNNSGHETLNWYFRDYSPSEHIEMRKL